MRRTALGIIEGALSRREVALWSRATRRDVHSLHRSLTTKRILRPEIPRYLIARYSSPGSVVLDPFSRDGSVALEAVLQERVAWARAQSRYAAFITRAKIQPADLMEVTLFLQEINFKRPVALDGYHERFAPFYDPETFRELLNLRNALLARDDRVSRFVKLIALGLLHGKSSGCFSHHTSSILPPSSEDQAALNAQRGERPGYRALPPRILRKTALVLRDIHPSLLFRTAPRDRVDLADPRGGSLSPASVNLVVTAPPLPLERDEVSWLRRWFFDNEPPCQELAFSSLDDWNHYMGEVLEELGRAVRPGGRAIFALGDVRLGRDTAHLDGEISKVVNERMSTVWESEGVIVPRSGDAAGSGEHPGAKRRGSLLLLRRR